MDDLRTILDGLDGVKLGYVYARSKSHTRTEAFRESGMSKSAFYELAEAEQSRLDSLAAQLRRNRLLMAEPLLSENIEKAVNVLVALLKSKNENVKLRAAVEIMNRVMGPVLQKTDLTSAGQPVGLVIQGVMKGQDADALAEPIPETGGVRQQ